MVLKLVFYFYITSKKLSYFTNKKDLQKIVSHTIR